MAEADTPKLAPRTTFLKTQKNRQVPKTTNHPPLSIHSEPPVPVCKMTDRRFGD